MGRTEKTTPHRVCLDELSQIDRLPAGALSGGEHLLYTPLRPTCSARAIDQTMQKCCMEPCLTLRLRNLNRSLGKPYSPKDLCREFEACLSSLGHRARLSYLDRSGLARRSSPLRMSNRKLWPQTAFLKLPRYSRLIIRSSLRT